MRIEGREVFKEHEEIPKDMDVSLSIRPENIEAIIKAFIRHSRLEKAHRLSGARDFSPESLAKAEIHGAISHSLFVIIGLFSATQNDSNYYLEYFKEDIHNYKFKDMSLILKPEMNN